ncbi:hypothetical protein BDW59DRAFT_165798 [Aspergillus cavernicola]|uniref:Major facilitator superfamily (MFS) profile domain-containing protein n=1 Tax=Aspergillus cavernicola TaxID=176166 RepID=A0ABR4HQT0_9EURO
MAVGAKANRYNVLIALFVTLGSFTYGYNSSVTAGVIGLPSFFEYLDIDTSTAQGNSIVGAINGVFLGGGAIGCWTLAWIADTIGRRRTIQVVCIICVISAAIQTGSVHVAMFLVGRLLNGFGVGMINCVIPLFQSEISPAAQRGRLVGFHGFILVAGYSCGGWTTFGTYHATNAALQWRLPLALPILAPLLLLCGSPWIPESPRWLVGRGYGEQGMKVLEALHRTEDDQNAAAAQAEYEHIQAQVAIEAEEQVGLPRLASVIWSHHHWDHTGSMELFPKTTELVVGPGFKAAQHLLPGFPHLVDSPVDSAALEGHVLTEIGFQGSFEIGGSRAYDFFGDGSFYLLVFADTPGHCLGHMCGLTRTTGGSNLYSWKISKSKLHG